MARKRPKQRAAIGVLGKSITRRSRGRCELCDGRNDNRLYELVPFTEDPDPDRVMMACVRCREWMEKGGVIPMEAHFLSTAVWSAEPSVRLGAARLLLTFDSLDDPWLQDALEATGVDPVTLEFREPATT